MSQNAHITDQTKIYGVCHPDDHAPSDIDIHDPQDLADDWAGPEPNPHPKGKWGLSCEHCGVFEYADTEEAAFERKAILERAQ